MVGEERHLGSYHRETNKRQNSLIRVISVRPRCKGRLARRVHASAHFVFHPHQRSRPPPWNGDEDATAWPSIPIQPPLDARFLPPILGPPWNFPSSWWRAPRSFCSTIFTRIERRFNGERTSMASFDESSSWVRINYPTCLREMKKKKRKKKGKERREKKRKEGEREFVVLSVGAL